MSTVRGENGRLPPSMLKEVLDQERDEEEYKRSQLAELMKQYGGKARVKIERFKDGGGKEWMDMLPVDDAMLENLEGTLGREFGGGRFQLKFVHGHAYITSLIIDVSQDRYPRKKAEPEKTTASAMPQTPEQLVQLLKALLPPPAPPAPAFDLNLFKLMIEEGREHSRQMMTIMQTQAAAQIAAASAGKSTDPAAELKKTFETLRALGVQIGSSGSAADDEEDPKRKLGVRVLEHSIDKVIDKFGDKAWDAWMGPDEKPKNEKQLPPKDRTAVPGGAQPVSKEEMEARMRATQKPKTPEHAAPQVKDAMPAAAEDKGKSGK